MKYRPHPKHRLKNTAMIQARKKTGLSIKEISKEMGISIKTYVGCELIHKYPRPGTQKKIIAYYASQGINFDKQKIFPEELKYLGDDKKYVTKKEIPFDKLVPLHSLSERFLPVSPNDIERKLELRDLVNYALTLLRPREATVLEIRYGLDEQGFPRTLKQAGRELGICGQRIRALEKKALDKLKKSYPLKQLVQ